MTTFHDNFERLLAAWKLHEEARQTGDLARMAEARWSLDAARYQTAVSRTGLR